MWIIAGLGNPETSHQHNRHNAGFIAVDHIIHRYRFSAPKLKFKALFYEGEIANEKVVILKPQTYMNKSGESLLMALQFYKVPIEQLLIFYDELDLPLGKFKVKIGGGNAGHNGLRSLDQHVGVDYWRIRIGIGHPGLKSMVSSYVLSDFTVVEHQTLDPLLQTMAEHIPVFISQGASSFTNKLHQPPPKNSMH
ncbi:MAG TPA: aminoacyl-tRNA hydrolase [Alphaproteobacteria bacterium]|jgi:PTH1 family peptidyl-tRNA hydrolase|nr:aminoacyl-tRNA hydrolase [Alphaproteobacteria bacterium]